MTELTLLETWAIPGALLLIAMVASGWYARWQNPPPPPLPEPEGFAVRIGKGGPAGSMEYAEGDRSLRLGWQLSAAEDVVVYVDVPTEEAWPGAAPWAADRRSEILGRVAEEVWRQQCRGCRWALEADAIVFYKERAR